MKHFFVRFKKVEIPQHWTCCSHIELFSEQLSLPDAAHVSDHQDPIHTGLPNLKPFPLTKNSYSWGSVIVYPS